ncbi:MAG: hypothetical protein FWB93_02800 [Oscillospiraceae bacterium]|nr:hypothetical protein [Oscillospiraceae bacterium]
MTVERTIDRVLRLAKERGINQKSVAVAIGVAQGNFTDWKMDRSKPSYGAVIKLSDYFEVSADYLLLKTDDPTPHTARLLKNQGDIVPIKRHRIPILGHIAAGKPIYGGDGDSDYIDVGCDVDADFSFKIRGDSMIGIGIKPGDFVLIKEQPMVDNGQVAAVCIDDEYTLKRVHYDAEKGILTLSSENPAYPPLVYVGPILDQVTVIGRAVVSVSRIK